MDDQLARSSKPAMAASTATAGSYATTPRPDLAADFWAIQAVVAK
jgi:hypothetical protein